MLDELSRTGYRHEGRNSAVELCMIGAAAVGVVGVAQLLGGTDADVVATLLGGAIAMGTHRMRQLWLGSYAPRRRVRVSTT